MSAGIYALDNDYNVTIYEKHSIAGGQCTGWKKQGVYIDGCAHWIVGTNLSSDLYPLWRHVGAIQLTSNIHQTEYFNKFDIDGEIITFYSDLEKLENELLRVSQEDKTTIKQFIRGVKAYKTVRIPVNKPLDHMNIFELSGFGLKMLPMLFYYLKYKKVSVSQFANKFKSPILKELFKRLLLPQYTMHSLFYIMQSMSKMDAGVIEGGSLLMANNIKDNFINKGGKIVFNKEVEHIIVENDVAKGIKLKDNSEIYADYLICSSDAHHLVYDLLKGKYYDKYFEDRFNDNISNPLHLCIYAAFKVKGNVSNLPKMINFKISPIIIDNFKINELSIRNYSFDKTLNKGVTTFTTIININEKDYEFIKSLSKEEYVDFKECLSIEIKDRIINYFKLSFDDIEALDVATPITYTRYTNAYKGAYMSFITTSRSKGLMRKGIIKGLKNFVMAGQWIMPPGGLPIALFSGKHAIYRICKMDKKKFVNLDYAYKNEAKGINFNSTY